MTNASDRELARWFHELRRRDEASAPSFRQILSRARPARSRSRSLYRQAAAAAAFLVLVVALAWLLPRPRAPLPGASIPIGEWKASTDVLLHTAGDALLASVPTVPESMPDYSSIAAAPKPGDTEPTRPPKGARS